jgi:hypothetical protein
MKHLEKAVLAIGLWLGVHATQAADIGITLRPDPSNPTTPTMGDWMHFESVINNTGSTPVDGLVAWISLVQVTPGQEQPMDLEDWSAQKAISGASLAPGASLSTDWPMRLIQSGDYRVVISTTDRGGQAVHTSPTVQFHVMPKAVVESGRILPVALGIPLVLGGLIGYRGWRGRHDL